MLYKALRDEGILQGLPALWYPAPQPDLNLPCYWFLNLAGNRDHS